MADFTSFICFSLIYQPEHWYSLSTAVRLACCYFYCTEKFITKSRYLQFLFFLNVWSNFEPWFESYVLYFFMWTKLCWLVRRSGPIVIENLSNFQNVRSVSKEDYATFSAIIWFWRYSPSTCCTRSMRPCLTTCCSLQDDSRTFLPCVFLDSYVPLPSDMVTGRLFCHVPRCCQLVEISQICDRWLDHCWRQ